MSFERRKVRTGIVVSDKMDKTAVVAIEWGQVHRLYNKTVKRRTRLVVHDPENSAKLGDMVRVRESRPISKTKRWRLVEVLTRADLAEIQPEEIAVEEDVLVAQRETPPDEIAENEFDGVVEDEEE